MGGFNPNDYDTVESRLAKFWGEHPDGRTHTNLIEAAGDRFIVRAEVYAHRDNTVPTSTGYAEEHVATRGVNQTSALENCETSALGRALANWKYAAKARPSQTEMGKAQRYENGAQRPSQAQQNGTPTEAKVDAAGQERAALLAFCTKEKIEPAVVAARFRQQYEGAELGHEQNANRLRAFRKLVESNADTLRALTPNGAQA